MYHHSDAGTLDGVCTGMRCQWSKIKPRATHFNMTEGKWVCFPCAQEANRNSAQINARFKLTMTKRPCISGKEYMLKVLMDE